MLAFHCWKEKLVKELPWCSYLRGKKYEKVKGSGSNKINDKVFFKYGEGFNISNSFTSKSMIKKNTELWNSMPSYIPQASMGHDQETIFGSSPSQPLSQTLSENQRSPASLLMKLKTVYCSSTNIGLQN